MPKQSKKTSETKSPLTLSVGGASENVSSEVGRKRKKIRDQSKREAGTTSNSLAEEAVLTALLFGGGSSSVAAAADLELNGNVPHSSYEKQDRSKTHGEYEENDGELMFSIDRSGVDVQEMDDDVQPTDIDEDVSHYDSNGQEQFSDDDETVEENGTIRLVSMHGAAWHDDDDEENSKDGDKRGISNSENSVSLIEGPNRIKKLRRYRDETNPISIKEYELRLRERFVNTASVAARTDWADVGRSLVARVKYDDTKRAQRSDSYDSDDSFVGEDEKNFLQSNASLFSSFSRVIPPTILDVNRVRDGNISDSNNSCVNALQFHPTAGKDYVGSNECSDRPLLMTAGMDKMLRFFRIDGENNDKIHGIHFSQMPVSCAAFMGDTGSVVLSGRRPFFYVYDAVSGDVEKIQASVFGRKERSLEKFSVSPDGNIIAFIGNDGYIILIDGKTRRWIGDLKMNGSVRAVTFSLDGEYLMGSGSDGDVYRWNVRSRRCVERFHNEDGTITSALAVSKDLLAVGAESGVVNLYNDKISSSFSRGLSLTDRTPIKSVMNMTSSADFVKFNDDGQILAMSTRRETNGLKLLHVPSATVFSNWPTSKTPLKYVWSLDFSPGSKYFCVGNDHGKCLLYQLKHFWEENI